VLVLLREGKEGSPLAGAEFENLAPGRQAICLCGDEGTRPGAEQVVVLGVANVPEDRRAAFSIRNGRRRVG
jgi:hypothetical protein